MAHVFSVLYRNIFAARKVCDRAVVQLLSLLDNAHDVVVAAPLRRTAHHLALRRNVARFLRIHRDEYEAFVSTDGEEGTREFDQYLAELAKVRVSFCASQCGFLANLRHMDTFSHRVTCLANVLGWTGRAGGACSHASDAFHCTRTGTRVCSR